MANPIIIPKKSTVAGKVPATTDLALGEIAINHADLKIFSRDPVSGNVNQIAASPTHSHTISEVSGLQAALDAAGGGGTVQSDSYSEPTYTNGALTALTTWSDNTKAVLVETKTFSYTSGNLTQVVVTDGDGATTLTKTLTYSGDELASVTKDFA